MATDKERLEQLSKVSEPKVKMEENDIDIFLPDTEDFKLGIKTYKIGELPLYKMKLLIEMSNVKDDTLEGLDQIAKNVSEILDEEDIVFILKNLTISKIMELGGILREVNYRGIPQATATQKKTIDSAKG